MHFAPCSCPALCLFLTHAILYLALSLPISTVLHHTLLYSLPLLRFSGYILNPDPSERPDIYQVCNMSFKLLGKPNPVANVFVSSHLLWHGWALWLCMCVWAGDRGQCVVCTCPDKAWALFVHFSAASHYSALSSVLFISLTCIFTKSRHPKGWQNRLHITLPWNLLLPAASCSSLLCVFLSLC